MDSRTSLYIKETGGTGLLVLAIAAGIAMLVALGLVFFHAPIEASMGVVQKIFYFHVPAAITAYLGFFIACGASIAYLTTSSRMADVVARAGAEMGVLFCAAVLISGPLWARKAWGTWWTGEPRLLATLVLCLIFIAYLVVRKLGGRSEMTAKICAVLAILGCADIPVIRAAVSRWRGNHPQVVTGDGGGLEPTMWVSFTAMSVAMLLLFLTLLWSRIRVGLMEEDVETMHLSLQPRRVAADDLADQ